MSIILLVLAALCFLLSAVNQAIFEQSPRDLIAWGLLCWVLSQIFGSAMVIYRERQGS